jgi:hypothetical protein
LHTPKKWWWWENNQVCDDEEWEHANAEAFHLNQNAAPVPRVKFSIGTHLDMGEKLPAAAK